MESEALRWLCEVADGATVATVARRHHISQPAVTRALHRLGDEVGVALTERTGRRLALTFAGRRLVAGARVALGELEAATRAIHEADDPDRGTVRLGFLLPLGTWLVPELIAAHRRRHPEVRFALRSDGARAIAAALHAGELDLCLTQADGSEPGVGFTPLFEDPLELALPADHPLAERAWIRLGELDDADWVVQPEGHGLRGELERLCAEAGFSPRTTFESPDLATLYALIAAGSGVGLLAARPRHLSREVRRVPLRPAARRTVGLMMRADGVIPSAAARFAEAVERYRKSLPVST